MAASFLRNFFSVTDAKGCNYQETFTKNPITNIDVIGSVISNVKCIGSATGSINYTVSGFSTNYSYSINAGSPITNQTASTISLTNLSAGIYNIIVTDSQTNCQDTATLTIASPATALLLNTTINPITCNNNASVNIVASGGWGSYQYTLTLPNLTVVGPQSSGVFSNLSQSGTYNISVKDGNDCIVADTFTINPYVNPTLTVNPISSLCYNSTTGATIVVTAANGQSPYQYSIDTGAFQTSSTFNNVGPGNHIITVKDSYGCTGTVNQVINSLLIGHANISKNLDCSTSPNAIIG